MVNGKNIVIAGIFFGCSVLIGEFSLGNASFPYTVWYFTKIPSWQWSLPVHLSGFLLLVLWNRLFHKKSIVFPIVLSVLFFLSGEALNFFVFGFFDYAKEPLGEIFSFWAVIFLYAFLCLVSSLILRNTQISD